MTRRVRLALSLLASLTVNASSALGQTPGRCGEDSDRATLARANALFMQAQDELDAGRAASAEELARAVLAQQESPNARLFLGRTLRAQSQWAAAYDQFDRAARDASTCAQREPTRRARYAQTIRAAIEDRDALAPRVGLLALRPTQPVSTDARVVVQGEERAFASDRPVPVMPGAVRFTFTARGFEPVDQRVEVRAGQVTEQVIELRVLRSLGAQPPREQTRDVRRPGRAVLRDGAGGAPFYAALSAASAGGASIAAGAVLFGVASTQFQALSSQCGVVGCPAQATFAQDVDRGELFERAGVALLITGGVALTAGTIAAILARPQPRAPSPGEAR